MPRSVFISGGTGYMGRGLAARLIERGHSVTILARPGSERKAPEGARVAIGNALDGATFAQAIEPGATIVHLLGVAHPAPWKGHAFRAIDLAGLRASATAGKDAGAEHFVYVSVAHPAPVMRAYIRVRTECESILEHLKWNATILRPWYVLGPGHRWPVVLRPLYVLAEQIPATRESARRLGLVTLEQMVTALTWAVEHPAVETRILEVPAIRALEVAASSIPVAR